MERIDNFELKKNKKGYYCKLIKPLTKFYKNIDKYDGLSSACKKCSTILCRKDREKKTEKYRNIGIKSRNKILKEETCKIAFNLAKEQKDDPKGFTPEFIKEFLGVKCEKLDKMIKE